MPEAKESSSIEKPATGRRWARIVKRIVILLLLIVVIIVFGVFPYWIATVATGATTRRLDRELTETPSDYQAEFKDVEFLTSDGVKISGWLLPDRGKRTTVIYSHGLFRSRRELLPRAIDLWRRGYGGLLYDSRNHGDSGPATVSLGYFERLDALAAVDFVRTGTDSGTRVVLYGISMGAATALLAAAESSDVSAVISDSSFLSFEDTIDHHLKALLGLPSFPLGNEIRFFIEHRAGFDGTMLSPLEAVKRIERTPLLFIAGASDKRMPPEIARQLYQAAINPDKDLLIVEAPGTQIHGHAYQAAPAEYVDRIDEFLGRPR